MDPVELWLIFLIGCVLAFLVLIVILFVGACRGNELSRRTLKALNRFFYLTMGWIL